MEIVFLSAVVERKRKERKRFIEKQRLNDSLGEISIVPISFILDCFATLLHLINESANN